MEKNWIWFIFFSPLILRFVKAMHSIYFMSPMCVAGWHLLFPWKFAIYIKSVCVRACVCSNDSWLNTIQLSHRHDGISCEFRKISLWYHFTSFPLHPSWAHTHTHTHNIIYLCLFTDWVFFHFLAFITQSNLMSNSQFRETEKYIKETGFTGTALVNLSNSSFRCNERNSRKVTAKMNIETNASLNASGFGFIQNNMKSIRCKIE